MQKQQRITEWPSTRYNEEESKWRQNADGGHVTETYMQVTKEDVKLKRATQAEAAQRRVKQAEMERRRLLEEREEPGMIEDVGESK